jgi:16S rRNA (adenine1518-N6/adenine1519-N6)-dimethyltransferase
MDSRRRRPRNTPAPGRRFASKRRRGLGQHFLTRRSALARVIDAVAPRPGEAFLEVGPGTGALTIPLLEAGARVLAVEIDASLARRLRERVPPGARFALVEGDFLRLDLPALLDREIPPGRGIRVAANLPYASAAPILLRLLRCSERFADLTVMLQREVADRILSRPGGREYGVLTILCAARAEPSRLLDLAPSSFTPPPKVVSTLLRLVPVAPPFAEPGEERDFERVVKAAFSRRRKTLRNSLAGGIGIRPDRAEVWIRRCGLDPDARPERIDRDGYLALTRAGRGETALLL